MIKLSKSRLPIFGVIMATLLMVVQVVTTLSLPNLTSDMVNFGIAKNDNAYIWQTGVRMLLVTALSVVAAIGNVYFAAKISQGLGQKLRHDIYGKVLGMSLDEFG